MAILTKEPLTTLIDLVKDSIKEVSTEVDTEQTRAANAESTLTSSIENEVTRAKEAETTLTNTIATLQTTIDELTARVAALENVVSW